MSQTAKQKEKEEQEHLANGGVPNLADASEKLPPTYKELAKAPDKENEEASENTAESKQSTEQPSKPAIQEVRVIRVPGMTWDQAGQETI